MRLALLLSGAIFYAPCAFGQATIPLPGGKTRPAPAPTPAPAPLPTDGQAKVPLPGAPPAVPVIARPPLNPYNRDVELTVPLLYRGCELGDIPILITKDNRFFVYRAPFEKLIDSLLNDTGKTKLANKLQ